MDTEATGSKGPLSYLRNRPDADGLPAIEAIRAGFGFVPNFFRVQASRPDLIEAEVGLIQAVMVQAGALTRQQKEYIFLICSAANLSTYCVTAHCEIVRMLGIDGPEPEQIAVDHTTAALSLPMKALLSFAAKLNSQPRKIAATDVDALRTFGYTEDQIMETVLMVGVAHFANMVSLGLGLMPDFENPAIAMAMGGRSGG